MPDQTGVPWESGERSLPGALFDPGLHSSYLFPRHDWQPPAADLLQQELPQYQDITFMARGGMGAVYRGSQKSLHRSVAIKVLPPEISQVEFGFSERFRREAEAMAQLSHPHIVSIFDAGETASGLLYFVMEFIQGTDVQQLLIKEGKLDPRRALQITASVCEALEFAHGNGVIHRDIKPSNVMLDQHNRAKVADFGLASVLGQDNHLAFTSSHLAMGTVDYIAPEALMPGMKPDHRVDLYATGVMLYNMLTGQIPRGRFDMPSDILPQADKRLDAIIDRAMRTDREKRYSSAAEMRAEMNEILEQPNRRHLRARASSPSTAPKRQSLVKPLVIGAAALSILAGGAFSLFPKRGADAKPASQPPPAAAPATPTVSPLVPTYKDRFVLPKGVWIPVKLSEAVVKGNGGELTAAGGVKLSHGLGLTDAAHHEFYCRDVALRLRLLCSEDTTVSTLQLRNVGPNGRKLSFMPHYSQLAHSPATRETWKPPVPHASGMGVGKPVLLELVAIGRGTYGMVEGQSLPPILSDEPSDKGGILIGSQDGEFRDIEVMILDGIPEEKALELAGVKTAQ
jgi:serine/threonine protein kinase